MTLREHRRERNGAIHAATRILFGMLGLICASGLLVGCSRENVRVFEVAKTNSPESAPSGAAASPTVEGSTLQWMVPAAWKVLPADGLRLATFKVVGTKADQAADISLVTFAGTGGDDLANVNRWRGQVQLPPLSPEQLAGCLTVIPTGAGQAMIVTIDGTSPAGGAGERIIGSWLRTSSRVWFIKISGPAALVAAQQQVFYDFLKTLHFDSTDLGQAANTSMPAASSGIGESVTWAAPSAWKLGAASAMRKASFVLGSGAEVSISAFPGDVGGLLANVNRWRTQVEVGPISADELAHTVTHVQVSGGELLEIHAGPAAPGGKAVVVATLATAKQTWFFKLAGDASAVVSAQPEFDAFLTSIATH